MNVDWVVVGFDCNWKIDEKVRRNEEGEKKDEEDMEIELLLFYFWVN